MNKLARTIVMGSNTSQEDRRLEYLHTLGLKNDHKMEGLGRSSGILPQELLE